MEWYREPVRRKYLASTCSLACCTQIFLWFWTLLLPFIIAYNTQAFWLKESTFQEQPKVKFSHDVLLEITGVTASGDPYVAEWTTLREYNTAISERLAGVLVKASEKDTNADGLPDVHKVSLEMSIPSGVSIHSARVLLFFSMELGCRTSVEGLAVVQHQAPTPGQGALVDVLDAGDLKFIQRFPLPAAGVLDSFANETLDRESLASPSMSLNDVLGHEAIVESYASHKLGSFFEPKYSLWRPGATGTFTFDIVARIPVQTIRYQPGIAEVFKVAWIQYLSVFLAVYWIVERARSLMFSQQVVETMVVWETESKKPKLKPF